MKRNGELAEDVNDIGSAVNLVEEFFDGYAHGAGTNAINVLGNAVDLYLAQRSIFTSTSYYEKLCRGLIGEKLLRQGKGDEINEYH